MAKVVVKLNGYPVAAWRFYSASCLHLSSVRRVVLEGFVWNKEVFSFQKPATLHKK